MSFIKEWKPTHMLVYLSPNRTSIGKKFHLVMRVDVPKNYDTYDHPEAGKSIYVSEDNCDGLVYWKEDTATNPMFKLTKIYYEEPHECEWQKTAASFHTNAVYYRNELVKIGEAIGHAAHVCDDGTESDEVLVAKVAELAVEDIKTLRHVERLAIPNLPESMLKEMGLKKK